MTVGVAVRQRIIQLCQECDISVRKLSGISGSNNSAIISTIKKLCDGLEVKAVSNKETRFGGGVCHWRTDTARMVYLFLLS